jgi:hypothetical protein
MKKLFVFIFSYSFLLSIARESSALRPMVKDSLISKKDTSWKIAGFFGLNFSSTSLSNWQGGGQNNIATNSILNLQVDYKKGKHEWTTKIDAQFGLIRQGNNSSRFRKNTDQIFALTKYNLKAFKKYWFYMLQADYRTQFAPGCKYSGDSIIGRASSDFNSPGYLQLAIGLDCKPADYLSITAAPVAGKVTMVNRQYLADEGAYGVEKAIVDASGIILTPGKKIRYEFGGRIIVRFKKDIFKNVNLDSYLDLFSNYANNPQNIDVVFNNLITFKINKYFTANIISQMIYDDDIVTRYDWNNDGKFDNKNDFIGPRLQMLTTLSVGFGYKF